MENIKQRGITYQIVESIPFLGKAGALIIDHTQAAIAEYGFVIGSIKGVVVGMIIAVVMITSIEAVTAVFDVVREEVRVRWTAGMIAWRRTEALQRGIDDVRRTEMHRSGQPETLHSGITYYAIDTGGHGPKLEGLTPWQTLDFLRQFEHKAVASTSLVTLPIASTIRPFFYNMSGRLATWDVPDKGKCAFADFEDNFILIPLAEYKRAGLPMKGDVRHDKN